MNHLKKYEGIIKNAMLENRIKLLSKNPNYVYYEKHHIIPKCLGGTNEEQNLVLLTAKEHFICHKLLTYIYPNNRKIIHALFRMTYNKKYSKFISINDYKYAKEKGPWNKGLKKCYSAETINKMSLARKGITLSEESKQKVSLNHRTYQSEETKQKISNNHGTKNLNVRKKISSSLRGRSWEDLYGIEGANKRRIETKLRFEKLRNN